MIATALTALLVFQADVSEKVSTAPPRSDTAVVVDSAALATAFVDPGARELLRRAREHRESVDYSIRSYRALARERISVGLNALRRERLLFRRETAARIHWRRFGTPEIEVLGAREAIPIVLSRERVPDDLDSSLPHLAFDPTDNRLPWGWDDDDDIRHPLAQGAEMDYRFASGDTTQIRLPDGRTIRLLELELIPRRSDARLLSGSLWLDAETYGIVQMVFRLARPFDLERDGDDPDDVEDVPGIFKPIRADIRYLTIEYGLWEMRWWLPRLVALDGYASAGSLLRVPVRYERLYSEYEVVGEPEELPPVVVALAGDSLRMRCGTRPCRCRRGRCRRVVVHVPDDTASLLFADELPASIFEEGEVLLSGSEVEEITEQLRNAPGAPPELQRPQLYWGLDRPGLTRYNRVEGLSIGATAEVDYGRIVADLTARVGLADLRPGVELGIERESPDRRLRVEGYRRLAPIDPAAQPFSLSNSLGAVLFGRDDGDYYRALGIALSGGPPATRPQWISWRLYAEHQRPAAVETHATLSRLWNRDARFRPNLQADEADQVGVAIDIRLSRGLDPVGFRWDAGLLLEGATGTYRFVRPGALLRVSGPLPGPFIGSIEAATGSSFGKLPVQSRWFLGGPATVRGYAPLTALGSAFWRGRAEIGTAFPGARIAAFSDLGWAGDRERFGTDGALLSIGVGASILDGILRFDLARALRTPTGWRAHFYVDAAL